jgi:hypothetical protein
MLLKEIIAVYSENHMENMNAMGKIQGFLILSRWYI